MKSSTSTGMSSKRLRLMRTTIGMSRPRFLIRLMSEAALPSIPFLPQSTTMQPIAASVCTAISASSTRRALMTWNPIRSMAATIWLTRRPSRSSASNIGAENRKVRRWEKFIASWPVRRASLLTARDPGGSVTPDRLLKTASRDTIKSACRRRGAGAALLAGRRPRRRANRWAAQLYRSWRREAVR